MDLDKILVFLKNYWWILILLYVVIKIVIRIATSIKNKDLKLEKKNKNPFPALLSIFLSFLKSIVRAIIGFIAALMIYGGVYALLIENKSVEGAEEWNLVVNAIFLVVAFIGLTIINIAKSDDKLVEQYGYRSLVYYIVYEFLLFNFFVLMCVIFFSKEAREFFYQYIPEFLDLDDLFIYSALLASLSLFLATIPYIVPMMKNGCFRCWTANAWSYVKTKNEGEYDAAIYKTTGGKYERVGTKTTTYQEVDECGYVHSSRQETSGIYEYKPRETKIVGYERRVYRENYERCKHCGKTRITIFSWKK